MRVQKRLGKIYSPAEVVSNNIAPMTRYCLVECSSPGNQALSSSSGDIRSLAVHSDSDASGGLYLCLAREALFEMFPRFHDLLRTFSGKCSLLTRPARIEFIVFIAVIVSVSSLPLLGFSRTHLSQSPLYPIFVPSGCYISKYSESIVPHVCLRFTMDQSTPPNAHTGNRDAVSSFSSSTPKITSPSNLRTPLAHEPLSPMLPNTPIHTAAVHQSTGSKTVKRNDNTMAGSSNPASSDGSSLLKYGPIPEPKLLCGLLRNTPAALSAHSQQTYYSERSYPTPVAPPPPGTIAVQVDEIRRCRAALPAPGTETETVVQRRQRQANERVFRYKNERTYRIPEPRFKNVSFSFLLIADQPQ